MLERAARIVGAKRASATVIAGLMLVGCGRDAEWQSFSDPGGVWEVEVPGEMTASIARQDGLRLDRWNYENGHDGYTISKASLPPDAPFALNTAVDVSVAGVLTDLEAQFETSGTMEIVEREAGLFLGAEDRTYTAVMKVGGRTFLNKGRVFVADGVLTQLIAIDDGDDDRKDIDRFLGSLTGG